MAIQFACPSCKQPIEVDDEHSGRQVSCPYCRTVVAAPVESDSQFDLAATDAAAPDARPFTPSQVGPDGSTPPSPPPIGQGPPVIQQIPPWASSPGTPAGFPPRGGSRKNIVGVIGLVCALASLGLYFVAAGTLVKHREDLGVDMEEKVDQAELQQQILNMSQELDKHPWLVKTAMCFLGSMACWLVGLVCSAVGMSKHYRSRAPAIAGLIGSVVLPLFTCAGLAIG